MTSPSKKQKPAPKDLQLAELSKGLDPAEVKKRPQGSGSVSYVTGEYIKRTLNRIFGFSNWSSEIVEMCCQDDSGGPWARARVKLEVVFADGVKVAREDVGFGSASPKQRDGRELAGKAAVTDGIKRAASCLGRRLSRIEGAPRPVGDDSREPAEGPRMDARPRARRLQRLGLLRGLKVGARQGGAGRPWIRIGGHTPRIRPSFTTIEGRYSRP